MLSIAVVVTCYNRRPTTLRFLRDLAVAALPPSSTLDIYLVDDMSTDGTGDAVQAYFPHVHFIRGTGNLYWGGGMRLAFDEAMKAGHDFYLWLNDDVELFPEAIIKLFEAYRRVVANEAQPVIIVGATSDPDSGHLTYSGRQRRGWHPLRFQKVGPAVYEPVPCETMNGNIVLIPATVGHRIGNIDRRFTHQMGDLDYGLRAGRAGISMWVCPGFVGKCRLNKKTPAWKDSVYSLKERMEVVSTPLGLPFRAWMTFAWRHGGPLGVLAGIFGYRQLFFAKHIQDETSSE